MDDLNCNKKVLLELFLQISWWRSFFLLEKHKKEINYSNNKDFKKPIITRFLINLPNAKTFIEFDTHFYLAFSETETLEIFCEEKSFFSDKSHFEKFKQNFFLK